MKIEEIFEKVKKEGEIFLGSFSSKELKEMNFAPIWGDEKEFFESFEFVDVYLLYDGEKLKIKYLFDGDPRYFYYESEEELGKYFKEIVEEYLEG